MKGSLSGTFKKETVLDNKVGMELSDALIGTPKERMEEEKTIVVNFKPGERPKVMFTGFWNGTILKAAMNSISKAYRLRRNRPSRAAGVDQTRKGPMTQPLKEEKK